MLWPLLNNLAAGLYGLALRIAAAVGHPKARQWREARQHALPQTRLPAGHGLWVHVASVGEYELARPVVDALKATHPHLTITWSYDSPSAANIRTPSTEAWHPLPLPTQHNLSRWVGQLKPTLALAVKYDRWLSLSLACQQHGVALVGLATRPPKGGPFLGSYYRKVYSAYALALPTSAAEAQTLKHTYRLPEVHVVADPRATRAAQHAATPWADETLQKALADRQVLIVGSCWLADVQHLAQLMAQQPDAWGNWVVILAPHLVHQGNLQALEEVLHRALPSALVVRRSALQPGQRPTLVLDDRMGALRYLYRLGHLAWVGGGWGRGLHNVFEPLAYGLPVAFGPRHGRFPEAEALVKAGAGLTLAPGAANLAPWLHPMGLEAPRAAAKAWFQQQVRAPQAHPHLHPFLHAPA